MKKLTALISMMLAMLFVFSACGETSGSTHTHVDADRDGRCDECNIALPPPEEEDPPVGGGSTGVEIDKSHPWTPPADEYTEAVPAGKNQITFYLNRSSFSDCDIWLWEVGGADGRGFTFVECSYGAKAIINIDEATTQVGFIVRTGCSDPGGTSWGTATKDATDSDRFISVKEHETYVFLKQGDAKAYAGYLGDKGELLLDELKTVDMADMRDLTHIRLGFSSAISLTADMVELTDGEGNVVEIASIDRVSSATWTLVTRRELTLDKAYTIKVTGYDDPVPVVPITYFSSTAFADAYNYDGKLGVEITDTQTIFRLWAPTAVTVKLNLYNAGSGGSAYKTYNLEKGSKGVWTQIVEGNLSGKYYTYTVLTSAGEQEAVDPYAVSAGVNGNRGMVLDLDTTDPADWSNALFVPSTTDANGKFNYTDAEIWEIHVRDFSNQMSSSQYKGKYLAFTETGLKNEAGVSVGVDYLKELGITHVHLMPSYDYSTVDEAAGTGFNWGYDPKNYNVPEGSYSTNPNDGAVRVNEFTQMVQALHANGIGVIMDVVYNHTSGLDSNLNKIVPYYYYRFQTNGKASNGSGCGNETASDRYMFRKYMLDSVTYWMEEYNVDGFRFDLMGLHDVTTMQEIEKVVHAINPNALIYGEGWTGGGTTLSSDQQSTLSNVQKVNANVGGVTGNHTNGVAMFSDVIRDAIKGGTNDNSTGFATGAQVGALSAIRFGVAGGTNALGGSNNKGSWSAYNPTNMINYASAHDNLALWDKICYAYGEDASTLANRLARNRLAAAIVQTSLGVPFMQAGEEMLRDKKNADGTYNENSYNSSDEVNNLKWSRLTPTSDQYKMMQYYSGLIAFRKANAAFRLPVTSDRGTNVLTLGTASGALLSFTVKNPYTGEQYFVVYNANTSSTTVTLPAGSWNLYIDGSHAGTTPLNSEALSGAQTVTAISCYVYKMA